MYISKLLGSADGQSSCEGKVMHKTEEGALRAAAAMAKKTREPFEAYKCRYCPGYHVGHSRFWNWTDAEKRKAGVK